MEKAEPAIALRICVLEQPRRLARKGWAGRSLPPTGKTGTDRSPCVFWVFFLLFSESGLGGEVGSDDRFGGSGWKESE